MYSKAPREKKSLKKPLKLVNFVTVLFCKDTRLTLPILDI